MLNESETNRVLAAVDAFLADDEREPKQSSYPPPPATPRTTETVRPGARKAVR